MTSYYIDKKTQRNVRVTFTSVFNVKGFKVRTYSETGTGKTSSGRNYNVVPRKYPHPPLRTSKQFFGLETMKNGL